MVSILASVFLLGILIFFHELGHFLAAKAVGVTPKIFSIGYGKGRWKITRGRTTYQITAFPLGGFVQFYGDDITEAPENIQKGDFFSVGPWRRILIAFGGPAFSVTLGVFVLGMLIALGWQPVSNTVEIAENTEAYEAGLRTGDSIMAVNGIKTDSYEKVALEVAFAPEDKLLLATQRGDMEVDLLPRKTGSIRTIPGMVPLASAHFLIAAADMSFPALQKGLADWKGKRAEWTAGIKQGDRIVSANGLPVSRVEDLRGILQSGKKSTESFMPLVNEGYVLLEIQRKNSHFAPDTSNLYLAMAPVKSVKVIHLKNIRDLQTGAVIPERSISALDGAIFSRIYVNNKNYNNFNDLAAAIGNSKEQTLRIGTVQYTATVELADKKMIGMSFQEGFIPRPANLPRDPVSLVSRSFNETWFAAKSTLLGLYRIIEGKLSFNQSVSGPVKIMAVAAKSVESGWDTYWYLLAQISIVLGIMNLLPIPVLDGGHIIFYLVEAVYKPLSPRIIGATVRAGMAVLLTFGVYVIGKDIYDVFVRGVLF